MSSQGMLNENLWLAKTVLIWKAACGYFFLIKTTHPTVSTQHFVPHHSSCLYLYHSTKISALPWRSRNLYKVRPPSLQQPTPQIATVTWSPLRSPGGPREPESALSLLLQPGWYWWPHTSADVKFFPTPGWLLLHKSSALSSLLYSNGSHQEGGREIHLRGSGHPYMMVQQNTSLLRFTSVLYKVAQPQRAAGFEVTISTKSSSAPTWSALKWVKCDFQRQVRWRLGRSLPQWGTQWCEKPKQIKRGGNTWFKEGILPNAQLLRLVRKRSCEQKRGQLFL